MRGKTIISDIVEKLEMISIPSSMRGNNFQRAHFTYMTVLINLWF